MKNKKKFGQFFTTNVDYILSGFEECVKNKSVLDPFAGGGDLLSWAKKNGANKVLGLDISKKYESENIKLNDSLKNIPNSEFILTNPPYLAKNKMQKKQKSTYDLSLYEDFYLLAIKNIISSSSEEGIIIIPVNFFSAENSDILRKEFLTKYNITKVNYFREQVFEDTTYNVVSFHYLKKKESSISQTISIVFFPTKEVKTFLLEEKSNYRVAGRELSKIHSIKPLKCIRLTEGHLNKNAGEECLKAFFNDKDTEKEFFIKKKFLSNIKKNIILLNCIDGTTEDSWIKAEDVRKLGKDCLVGKLTSRNIAYVMLPDISLKFQEKIIPMFNEILFSLRKEFNSLFLTNFRDKDRKRISFDFCYKLITYCYEQIKATSVDPT